MEYNSTKSAETRGTIIRKENEGVSEGDTKTRLAATKFSWKAEKQPISNIPINLPGDFNTVGA